MADDDEVYFGFGITFIDFFLGGKLLSQLAAGMLQLPIRINDKQFLDLIGLKYE